MVCVVICDVRCDNGVQGSGDRSAPDADPFLMPSKAQNMVDEMRQAIASLPPDMDAMCKAIAAKGGPKVPPGSATHTHSLLSLHCHCMLCAVPHT